MSDNPIPQSGRLEHIDALRGMAMLMVIYSHVEFVGIGLHTGFNAAVATFRMPLFFFISGFLAYTAGLGGAKLRRRTQSRITRQLWPTVLVFGLFVLWRSHELHNVFSRYLRYSIHDPLKMGYWFTFSLVSVFLVYALLLCLFRLTKADDRRMGPFFAIVTIVAAVASAFVMADKPASLLARMLSVEPTVRLAPWFFLGVCCKIHSRQLFSWLDRKWIVAVMAAVFIATAIVSHDYGHIITRVVLAFAGIFMAFGIVHQLRVRLTSASPAGRWLGLIGRNTLPIYLLHYFAIHTIHNACVHGNPFITAYCKFFNAPGVTGIHAVDVTVAYAAEIALVLCVAMTIALAVLALDALVKRYVPVLHHLVYRPDDGLIPHRS